MPRIDGFMRIVQKGLPQGSTPSVPLSDDHTDGSWLYTDLYDREIAINDNGEFYYRSMDTIYTFNSATGGSGTPGATGATGADGYRAVMNLSYTGSSLTLGLGALTLPIGTPINNLGWQEGTRIRVWHSATQYMEGQVSSPISNPQTSGIHLLIDYVVGSGTFGSWYCGIAGDRGASGATASGGTASNLNQVLINGNESGDNDIKMNLNKRIYTYGGSTLQNNFGISFGRDAFGPGLLLGGDIGYWGGSTPSTFPFTRLYYTDGLDTETAVAEFGVRTPSGPDRSYLKLTSMGTDDKLVSFDNLTVQSGYTLFNRAAEYVSIEGGAGSGDILQVGGGVYTIPGTTFYSLNGKGIEYGYDYSSTFTSRSLVDKAYVDSHSGGITYSGSMDYTTYFDSNNSLLYTDTYYNSGRYTVGHYTGTPWVYDHAGKFNVYSPYSMQPAIIAEGGQFGGLFIAADNTASGQLIGLQGEARGSQVSGNLGVYGVAAGTQSSNIGGQFSAYNGVIYPGYGGASNTGVVIDVSSGSIDPSIAGVTNSGMLVSVSGRVGDNNYIGTFQDGSQGAGKVLTCIDGTGLATWQTPTATGGGTVSQILTQVRNQSGSTMRRGMIVYISGSTGNLPLVTLSQANMESTSARTYGVIRDDISNNGTGYVVTIGSLQNLDTRSTATYPFTTDTLADGDRLYLSPTTAGYVTKTKPSAPNHLVYIGTVVRTSPTNGYIEYQIQNGYELEELHNVSITTTPSNGQVLAYETSTSLWKPVTISSGATPSLSQVLVVGNTTGANNIIFNNTKGLKNSSGEGSILLDQYSIDATHKKYTNATDWKRGSFVGGGNIGVASITGDNYDVTANLYKGSSVTVNDAGANIFYQETVISTSSGMQTAINVLKNSILVNSSVGSTTPNTSFQGMVYNYDHSANFTNRSLVDKAYVDSKVAGATGSQSLANVLSFGNTASTSINMASYSVTNISSLGSTTGDTIEMVNILNMSLMALMYNT